ncbi:MAG: hypothetical protein AB7L70_18980, partial [Pyrinomonadaceae bacterium]
ERFRIVETSDGWGVKIGGELLLARWNSRGAALAGARVELYRRARVASDIQMDVEGICAAAESARDNCS